MMSSQLKLRKSNGQSIRSSGRFIFTVPSDLGYQNKRKDKLFHQNFLRKCLIVISYVVLMQYSDKFFAPEDAASIRPSSSSSLKSEVVKDVAPYLRNNGFAKEAYVPPTESRTASPVKWNPTRKHNNNVGDSNNVETKGGVQGNDNKDNNKTSNNNGGGGVVAAQIIRDSPNVGKRGGTCTCPDGQVYYAGYYAGSIFKNKCSKMACFGGTPGPCNKWPDKRWARTKVICPGFEDENVDVVKLNPVEKQNNKNGDNMDGVTKVGSKGKDNKDKDNTSNNNGDGVVRAQIIRGAPNVDDKDIVKSIPVRKRSVTEAIGQGNDNKNKDNTSNNNGGSGVVPALIIRDAPNVGRRGGTCTCPDGQVYYAGYYAGRNIKKCSKMACIGGTPGTCSKGQDKKWARTKVICPGFEDEHEDVVKWNPVEKQNNKIGDNTDGVTKVGSKGNDNKKKESRKKIMTERKKKKIKKQ